MGTILVTGGAGFIGHHVCDVLLARGDKVVVVDNLNDYYDPQIKKDRLKKLQSKHQGLTFHKVDIANQKALNEVFEEHHIDKIIHLAAQAGVRNSLKNPHIYHETNGQGTLNILEACRKYDVKNLVFASTSSVYGKNTPPFHEKQNTDTQMSLYAATKKYNEVKAHTYHDLFGINAVGLRFFTVYGPFGRPDMALFKFTKGITEGTPIDVYNHGKMARDFTYVDDIVQGVVSAVDRVQDLGFEIINLARGETVQLMDFINEIEENLGQKAEMNMMPMQLGDVPGSDGDISKAQELLDYNPQVSYQEGVKNFVEWYKDYYNVPL